MTQNIVEVNEDWTRTYTMPLVAGLPWKHDQCTNSDLLCSPMGQRVYFVTVARCHNGNRNFTIVRTDAYQTQTVLQGKIIAERYYDGGRLCLQEQIGGYIEAMEKDYF